LFIVEDEFAGDMPPTRRARIDLRSTGPNTLSKPELRYDGQTVVVTDAGSGLGKACALFSHQKEPMSW
jgi:hypothetical protein